MKRKTIIENAEQRKAFEMWVKLGPTRTQSAVATAIGRSKETLRQWHDKFDWDSRLVEIEGEKREEGMTVSPSRNLLPAKHGDESEMQTQLREIIENTHAMIVGSYAQGPDGTLQVPFKIKSMKEFSLAVRAFREAVETYHRLTRVAPGTPQGKDDKLIDIIRELVHRDGMDKEASIAFLKGHGGPVPNGVTGGHTISPGGISEGDFEEVRDRGDTDTRGVGGVPRGVGETSGGDEGDLRESGTPVPLLDFVESDC